MTPSKGRILALWRDDPSRILTLAAIGEALHLKKHQRAGLRTSLGDLVAAGQLARKRRGFLRVLPEGGKQTRAVSSPGGKARTQRPAPKAVVRQAIIEGAEGWFAAHPTGFGFVEMPGSGESVMIPQRHIGGALDGDRVRIERLPARGRLRGAGRIVAVLERRRTHIRGRLEQEAGQWWLAPLNGKLPLIFLGEDADPQPARDGEVAEAEIIHYPERHDEAPEGRLLRAFGREGDSASYVIDHILHDLGLSERFSTQTRAEMNALAAPAPTADGKRKNLGHLPFVTIDGEDARDFDDAVCLESLPRGQRRLWVAIADVAAYVTPGSAVDQDAYRKGTSVYFPRRVLPMLPRKLSNNLCSLKPGQPRLVIACAMDIDTGGHRTGYRIHEGLIESQARLAYTQVQQYFESGQPAGMAPHHAEMLSRMRELAAQLRELRHGRGALNFQFPEVRFQLDRQGHPRRMVEVFPTEATRLIEQFMLEANETVASHCLEHGLPALYRVHDPPPPDKLPALTQALWNFGLPAKERELTRPQGIQALLARAAGLAQRESIELAILKAMSQAQYRARNEGHFALAARQYCHFTSPIRRYPDLLVHRALKAQLAGRKKPLPPPTEAGMALSFCERNAAEAEARVKRLYGVLFMESRLGNTFAAEVLSVSERGLWLRLRKWPLEGMLPAADLPGHPPTRRGRGGRPVRRIESAFSPGDRLTVRLVRADRLAQQLDFTWVERGWQEGVERSNPAHGQD